MAAENKDKKPAVDWDAIEPHWRAGIKTKLEMSTEFGVSRAAMDKHFAKRKIARNLAEKISDRAESLVTQDAVTPEVTRVTEAKESEIVEANAQMIASAIRSQRKDVSKARSVVEKMFAELEVHIDGLGDLIKMSDILANGDDEDLARLCRKVISLPSRVDSGKKLIESMRIAIELERKVLRIKDEESSTGSSSIEDILQAVHGK